MTAAGDRRVREAYDLVARDYEASVAEELDRKPLDRGALDAFASGCATRRPPTGAATDRPVLDAGCGPGHTIAHLRGHGLAVSAVDLSPVMVELASRRNPDAEVTVGSLLRLPYPDDSFAGVLSLYSIIHLPPHDVPAAIGEMARVLAPGGTLMIAFHSGDRQVHLDEWFGHVVDLDGYLFDPALVVDAVTTAGLVIDARIDRRPLPDIELATTRTTLLAHLAPPDSEDDR